jgi:hypothetical protein
MRASAFAVAVSIGFAVGSACLLDLDHEVACGDDHVDPAAGEECEPELLDTYINACVGTSRPAGKAACDPVTCEIINDLVQCAKCGDSLLDIDAGEECDGEIIPQECWRGGVVKCTPDTCKADYSLCDKCGNGFVDMDEGEECDPEAGGGIAILTPCQDLKSPYVDQPYSSGSTISCLDDCTFDRTECGYCKNGELEKEGLLVSLPSQPMTMSRPEKCDGVNFDLDELASAYPACGGDAVANVACANNCLGFVEREGPECCLPKGAVCPADDAPERCCHEFSEPMVEEHCSDPFAPPGVTPPEGGSKCN